MAAYESKANVRYKELMNKLLTEGDRPIYVTEEAWHRNMEYWESDDFKARSKIASSNRRTKKGGSGIGMSKHTGGSIPFLVHEERLSKELERDCTPLELYLHVYTKKHDGQTFIDARSERVNSDCDGGCRDWEVVRVDSTVPELPQYAAYTWCTRGYGRGWSLVVHQSPTSPEHPWFCDIGTELSNYLCPHCLLFSSRLVVLCRDGADRRRCLEVHQSSDGPRTPPLAILV
ncbi:hypothetical protein Sjap_005256 [Stephania japonica]|uniref:Uncharacterized protein n=1 Tax=Stephania japonica TaxID=461633 RepID=A0AAP0K586_9MAGN